MAEAASGMDQPPGAIQHLIDWAQLQVVQVRIEETDFAPRPSVKDFEQADAEWLPRLV